MGKKNYRQQQGYAAGGGDGYHGGYGDVEFDIGEFEEFLRQMGGGPRGFGGGGRGRRGGGDWRWGPDDLIASIIQMIVRMFSQYFPSRAEYQRSQGQGDQRSQGRWGQEGSSGSSSDYAPPPETAEEDKMDPWKVLGVEKAGATEESVRKAYKALALKVASHPRSNSVAASLSAQPYTLTSLPHQSH